MVNRAGAFELFAHDGVVVYNDPSGPEAGVVDADGTVHPVDKHARTSADPAPNAVPPPTAPALPPSPEPPPPAPTSPPTLARRTTEPIGPTSAGPTPATGPPSGDVDDQVPLTTTPDAPARTRAAPSTSTSASASTTQPTTSTTSAAAEGDTCDEQSGGTALVDVDVTSDGSRSGLTFCPVLINDGDLPITGPYPLAGQVLGLDDRLPLLIVAYADPDDCDAFGNPPAPGRFAQDATFDSSTGRWSFTETLGYIESVTIARRFEYITGSAASLAMIRQDHENWLADDPEDPTKYPGMVRMPADTKVLGTFAAPAGEYPGAVQCTGG